MFAAVRRKSRPKKLYNGDGRWTAATDVADLIPQPPGLLAKYLPHLEYLLIDEHRQDLAELAGMKNLVAAAIRFERPDRAAALVELIDVLNQWLGANPNSSGFSRCGSGRWCCATAATAGCCRKRATCGN
jgi:hypothetical protein